MKTTKENYSYGYAMHLQKPFKEKEKELEISLNKYEYYIIRFDGVEMTKAFKIKNKAINVPFFETMKKALYCFVEKYPEIILAYSFSDEISVLFKSNANKDDMFSRNQKLLSILSAHLALEFKKAIEMTGLDNKEKDWLFDARIIGCNKEEAIRYFIARQALVIDKYLKQLKGEKGITITLNKSKEIIDALKEKGINYENLNPEHKYGLIYSAIQKDIQSFEFKGDQSKLSSLIE